MPNTPIAATLIPGDGIGPEIIGAAVRVLDALGRPFEWDVQQGGMAAIAAAGDPLPLALLDSVRRTRLALKGPLTTPVGRSAADTDRSTCGCGRSSNSTPTCVRTGP